MMHRLSPPKRIALYIVCIFLIYHYLCGLSFTRELFSLHDYVSRLSLLNKLLQFCDKALITITVGMIFGLSVFCRMSRRTNVYRLVIALSLVVSGTLMFFCSWYLEHHVASSLSYAAMEYRIKSGEFEGSLFPGSVRTYIKALFKSVLVGVMAAVITAVEIKLKMHDVEIDADKPSSQEGR